MPKSTSKAQQRWWWAQARKGRFSAAAARKHSRKGKAFAALPARKRKGQRR